MNKTLADMEKTDSWQNLPLETIRTLLATDFETGLPSKEAALRLRLADASLERFLRYLYGRLKWIIAVCFVVDISAIALVRNQMVVWMLIVQVLAILGLIAIYHNRRRMRVIRDGRISDIDVDDVVIGDVIELLKGDVVPRNARLIESDAPIEDMVNTLRSNSRTFLFVKKDAMRAVMCGKPLADLKMDRIREE